MEGNVFDLLPTLESESIDCAITSPPYWMLRSYLPRDHPLKPLELGSEPTPQAFVENLVAVCRLVRRALADHGTFWLNIGDTYANTGGHTKQGDTSQRQGRSNVAAQHAQKGVIPAGMEAGNLCLIPQRLAIALQDDGWIVRSIVVWHKPACMPASLSGWAWRRCRVKVKGSIRAHTARAGVNNQSGNLHRAAREGRVRDPHAEWQDCPGCKKCEPHGGYVLRKGSWRPTSSWEPILMLARTANYFADGEPVKTPPAQATVSRDQYTRVLDDPDEQFAVQHDHETQCDDGANLRDVWTIASESMTAAICENCGHFVKNAGRTAKRRGSKKCPQCGGEFSSHYAAFPSELVSKCLQAGVSAKGYCPGCGLPWVRVLRENFRQTQNGVRSDAKGLNELDGRGEYPRGITETTTLAWKPSCNCIGGADMVPRPGRVLDPFSGSGRTLLEARRLGFDAVGVELNENYARMARELLSNEMPLFS